MNVTAKDKKLQSALNDSSKAMRLYGPLRGRLLLQRVRALAEAETLEDTISLDIAFHPGETLKEKLEEMSMSVQDFAEASKVPETMVNDILNGDASVSSEVAIAFEQVTKIPARMWIRLQHSYDDYFLAQKRSTYMERLLHLARSKAAVL